MLELPCVAVALVLAWVAPVATGVPPIGVAGNDRWLWVYQVRVDPERGVPGAWFARRTADGRDTLFRPVPISEMGGNIAFASVCADSLHLIFVDGTHRSLSVSDMDSGASAAVAVELPLPDSAIPMALTADGATGALWAVVGGQTACRVVPPASGPEEPTSAPAGAIVSAPPAYALLRYQGGQWALDRDVTDAATGASDFWLAVNAAVCHLFFAVRGGADDVHYCELSNDGWSPPVDVPGLKARYVAAVAVIDAAPLVVADDGRGGVEVFQGDGREWLRHPLRLPPDFPARAVGELPVAGVLKDRIALGAATASGDLRVGLWPATGGDPVEPPVVVETRSPVPRRTLDSRFRMAIPFVFLSAVLMAVLSRRRAVLGEPAQLAAHQALAGYARRAAAFALDLVIMLPGGYWFLLRGRVVLPPAEAGDAVPVNSAVMAFSFELFWLWLVGAAAFVVYCTVFEAALAATPGKLVMQCRVTDERGRRCSFVRVLVRNLARLIEMYPLFELLPSAVLMLLTRKRQRLGDLMAGTIVVERIRGAPSSPEGDSDTESTERRDDENEPRP